MDPTAMYSFIIIFSVAFMVRLLLTTMMYCSKMIPISSDDFQRLVAQEVNAKIFWKMTMRGGYWYVSGIGGNQIYTKSKQRLEFPETCELILIKHY